MSEAQWSRTGPLPHDDESAPKGQLGLVGGTIINQREHHPNKLTSATPLMRGHRVKNALGNPDRASVLATPPAAVLADKITQFASSFRSAISDAERYPSSVSVAWSGGVSRSSGSNSPLNWPANAP